MTNSIKINWMWEGEIDKTETIPVAKNGEKFLGDPKPYSRFKDLVIPEGWEVYSHYQGWEEGEAVFAAPSNAKLEKLSGGCPVAAPEWRVSW